MPIKSMYVYACDFCPRSVETQAGNQCPPEWYEVFRVPARTNQAGQLMCPDCMRKLRKGNGE